VGGGITAENASEWLDAGASHVIVTSYVFHGGQLHMERLERLLRAVGRQRLVLDLSCRKRDGRYFVVTDRWQKFTDVEITPEVIEGLSRYADEFLVHGVDVEGKCMGVDLELVRLLARHVTIACTYAGGAKSIEDAYAVLEEGMGRLDLTIGSAMDIFGGKGVSLEEVIEFNRVHG
jgi:phosphoribosylformimino-5-aminoimidazole carboxamide ribotide isomerase